MSAIISFPETLKNWPYPRKTNPHYRPYDTQTEMIDRLGLLNQENIKQFVRCNLPLFSSLTYSLLSEEGYCVGLDFINLGFMIDQVTDNMKEWEAAAIGNLVSDAVCNPQKPRPEGEHAIGELARLFGQRLAHSGSKACIQRFCRPGASWDDYCMSMSEEARDREDHRVRSVEEYMRLRIRTVGVIPTLDLLLFDIEIPEDVLDHPTMSKLRLLAGEIICLENDLYSYQREVATGDPMHNIVDVAMQVHGMHVQDAIDWVAKKVTDRMAKYLKLSKEIFWDDRSLDTQVRIYISGMANWITGNQCWSFEGQRYFGKDVEKVRKERKVMLTNERKTVICW
ncbi:terpenoid synthase [Cylindrobasidium torrendii FP15055 ss-10]|uniref:Terpene synthase n=1 Tax=Cylindrobasidium torrendii FP15055 ss-10 TaxID=1314674 RepID=A0A0D7AU93_9AGAR|nr:terpenoid synthase [Cylindrobasidium torrendii FP15055 ss-10]